VFFVGGKSENRTLFRTFWRGNPKKSVLFGAERFWQVSINDMEKTCLEVLKDIKESGCASRAASEEEKRPVEKKSPQSRNVARGCPGVVMEPLKKKCTQ
jgi:hypothetical protein